MGRKNTFSESEVSVIRIVAFITYAVLVFIVVILVDISNHLEEERNKMQMKYLDSQIEYLRLKTAMALVGIDDFVETSPGHVEVKVIK